MNAAYVAGLRTSAKASSTTSAVDSVIGGLAMLAQAPGDVVDAYDGVVDDYRDGHGEPRECDRVERLTAQVEHERRHHQRQRDRYEADQRGAQREQEGREDERQENAADDDRKP